MATLKTWKTTTAHTRAPEQKRHYYRAFDLTFASALPLPELQSATAQTADVTIREGRTPEDLPTGTVTREGWLFGDHLRYQIGTDQVLLSIREVGRFLIQDSNSITIERQSGVDDDRLRIYLLGSCFGFLLLSRGLFAFHGSAVTNGEHCLLFVGDSGVGKSTTATAFLQQGYHLLADDVSLVKFNAGGRPEVFPAFPQVKLWGDSTDALALDHGSLQLVSSDWEKFKLPIEEGFSSRPAPVSAVFELRPTDTPRLAVRQLTGAEKYFALSGNIYRGAVITDLGLQKQHFAFCARLIESVPVFRIERPFGAFQLRELVTEVEKALV